MTHVTCRLTAKNRDELRNPTLGNRVWATFTFFMCRGQTPAQAEWNYLNKVKWLEMYGVDMHVVMVSVVCLSVCL